MAVSTTSSPDDVYRWLKHADDDAKGAIALVRSGQRLQALFSVQQSMEKVIKGIHLSVGASYEEIEGHKHDTLASFLALNRLIAGTDFVPFAWKKLFEPEIFENLSIVHQSSISGNQRKPKKLRQELEREYQEIFRIFGSRSISEEGARIFRSRLATLSPQMVGVMLDTQGRVRELLTSATSKPFKLASVPPEADLVGWLMREIMPQVYSRLPKKNWRKLSESEISIFKMFIDAIGEAKLREALQEPTQTSVELHFKWIVAYLNLYILGAISWPHAVSTRYPTSPKGPSDPADAARENRMGSQHYSDEIGALAHVGTLAREAEWTTKVLISCRREGIGLFQSEDSLRV